MRRLIKIRNAGGGICLKKRKNGKNGKKNRRVVEFRERVCYNKAVYPYPDLHLWCAGKMWAFWGYKIQKNCVAEIWKGEKPL